MLVTCPLKCWRTRSRMLMRVLSGRTCFATNQAVSDQAMKMKLPAACGMSMKMNRSKSGGRLIGAHIKVSGSSGGKDSHYRVLDTRFVQSHGPYLSPLLTQARHPAEGKAALFVADGKANLLCCYIFFSPWIPGTAACCCLVLQTVTVLLYTQIVGSFYNLFFLLCFFPYDFVEMAERGGGWGGTVKWRRPAIFTLILWPPRLFLSPSQRRWEWNFTNDTPGNPILVFFRVFFSSRVRIFLTSLLAINI